MMTVDGLFGAGDTIGGTAHKFSSGSFTEGRIAGKAAVNYVNDLGNDQPQVSEAEYEDSQGQSSSGRWTTTRSAATKSSGEAFHRAISCQFMVCSVSKRSWTNMSAASAPITRPTNRCSTRGQELLDMLKGRPRPSRRRRPSPASARVGTSAPGPGLGVCDAAHDVPNGNAVARATIIGPIIRSWMTPIGIASPCPATIRNPGIGPWRRPPYTTSSTKRTPMRISPPPSTTPEDGKSPCRN